jgi:LuxR family maltose regulon positive regulatory protein
MAEQIAQDFDAMQADDVYVAANKAQLELSSGDTQAAQNWLEQRQLDVAYLKAVAGQDGCAEMSLMRAAEYMILAELHIAQGRGDDALAILGPLRRLSECAGWTGITLKLLALEALAWQTEQNLDRAMVTLVESLALAEPEGYVQSFVDQGEPMARLLSAVGADLRQHPDRYEHQPAAILAYVHKLLEALGVPPASTQSAGQQPGIAHARSETLLDPLSDRELQVLRLLNTPLSSTEIAEQLYLSVNTVRSHIKSIYGKLDVHRRTEAISHARELGLL